MKPLFDLKEIKNLSGNVEFECYFCSKVFTERATHVRWVIENKQDWCKYCGQKCFNKARRKKIDINCNNCNKVTQKTKSEIKQSKSGLSFCSQSCAATYNNTHKTKGTRRSKLEKWIEEQISKDYPELDVIYNSKKAINSELDIYFPSLKLAVELNGIYHYESIHGPEKLASIQNNDDRKFQACLEQGIELVIIDSSGLTYFKPQRAKKYYDVIVNILIKKQQSMV